MSHRRTAVYVGVLFIAQMLLFIVGSSLVTAYLEGDAGGTALTVGVVLEMGAGVAVVAIGLLMYRVLRLWTPGWRCSIRPCGSPSSPSRRFSPSTC